MAPRKPHTPVDRAPAAAARDGRELPRGQPAPPSTRKTCSTAPRPPITSAWTTARCGATSTRAGPGCCSRTPPRPCRSNAAVPTTTAATPPTASNYSVSPHENASALLCSLFGIK
jgi:hypothetical protein